MKRIIERRVEIATTVSETEFAANCNRRQERKREKERERERETFLETSCVDKG